MDETGIKLLNLMFRPGETISVSSDKFGYYSIPFENAIKGTVTLFSPNSDVPVKYVDSSKLIFVALNPIEGFRQDVNCYKFRNFLVEIDEGPNKEPISLEYQMEYIKRIGMPFSAAIFSGGKSLHFLISLDTDLPSEKVYRFFTEWLTNIATWADPNCINPSRSIRIPGAMRDNGNRQVLKVLNGVVRLEDFVKWLNQYPHSKPKEKKQRQASDGDERLARLSKWARKRLAKGLSHDKGRNKQWFSLACDFALSGYSEDDTLDILSEFFVDSRDFKEREWKSAIKSGFKYIYNRKR